MNVNLLRTDFVQKFVQKSAREQFAELARRNSGEFDYESMRSILKEVRDILPCGQYIERLIPEHVVYLSALDALSGKTRVVDIFVLYTDWCGKRWSYPVLWFLDKYCPFDK